MPPPVPTTYKAPAPTNMRHNPKEDINGYIRGAHKDGPEVCPGYVFHKPGSSSTPEKTIWGWNDTDTFYCDRCKLPAVDHMSSPLLSTTAIVAAPAARASSATVTTRTILAPRAPMTKRGNMRRAGSRASVGNCLVKLP